jgi:hypothetical protein
MRRPLSSEMASARYRSAVAFDRVMAADEIERANKTTVTAAIAKATFYQRSPSPKNFSSRFRTSTASAGSRTCMMTPPDRGQAPNVSPAARQSTARLADEAANPLQTSVRQRNRFAAELLTSIFRNIGDDMVRIEEILHICPITTPDCSDPTELPRYIRDDYGLRLRHRIS